MQHTIDQEPEIWQNPRFPDRSGSGNPNRRVNHPDVLRDREESSQRPKQTEEHVVMVGSWPCKVSSEVHINGRHASELVRNDKVKMMATEPKDGKDPKRAWVVLSKGHEVVELGYSQSNATRIGLAGLPGLANIATQTGKQIGLAGLAKIVARTDKQIELAGILGLAQTATQIDG
jgi:hypothetical protein